MKKEIELHLADWLTDDISRFASKITSEGDSIFHDHSFYEVFYITKGNIDHQYNDELEELYAGDCYFMNIGDKHSFVRKENTVCEHRDIIIRPSLFKEICNGISPTLFDEFVGGQIKRKINLSTNHIKELESKIQFIDHLLLNNPKQATAVIRSLLYSLFGTFYYDTLQSDKEIYPSWLYELLARFNDIALLKAGLSEITKPFYFSIEHICRTFKKYTGITMTDYLNQRRIFEAANMLVYTDSSIKEICGALGMESASYFNKLFKSQYHTTPYQFRKKRSLV